MKTEFSIAREFTTTPSARKVSEGKYSGSELRAILSPLIRDAIRSKQHFTVILDGTAGYGTSFLEEVFGGLVRDEHFNKNDLKSYLIIISEEDPDLICEIWDDIEAA